MNVTEEHVFVYVLTRQKIHGTKKKNMNNMIKTFVNTDTHTRTSTHTYTHQIVYI